QRPAPLPPRPLPPRPVVAPPRIPSQMPTQTPWANTQASQDMPTAASVPVTTGFAVATVFQAPPPAALPAVAPEGTPISQEAPAVAAATPAPKPARRRPPRRPRKPAQAAAEVVIPAGTVAEPSVAPAAEPLGEPEVPPWLEPAMQEQPATESLAQQAEQVTEPAAEPVTEPVAAPAVPPAKPRRRSVRWPAKAVEPSAIIPAQPGLPAEPVEPMAPFVPAEATAKPRRRRTAKPRAAEAPASHPEPAAPELAPAPVVEQVNPPVNGEVESAALAAEPPRTGVEILAVEDREGVLTYTVRDLRNNNIVRNVTRFSARHLWKYAITEREDNPLVEEQICWLGHLGLWKTYTRAGAKRYNLVQRDSSGNLHVYYGVTEDGIHGEWRGFLEGE
ncbi:MAG: hypothetical protein Q8O07_02645, partial [Chloroflexota bacterium]|nr:hypothetical protein [Chloroflexota bacterium]